jgi:hypothetical protein
MFISTKQFLKATLTILLLSLSTFVHAQEPAPNVFLYRESKLKGAIITYNVYYNDSTLVGTIKNGVVVSFVAPEGMAKFSAKTESKRSVFINVKPGETYYIKCDIVMGAMAGNPSFRQVNREVAEPVINSILSKKQKP